MVRELKITITTSTETKGDSVVLMEEILSGIVDDIQNLSLKEQGVVTKGDIELDGYEVEGHYEITEIR